MAAETTTLQVRPPWPDEMPRLPPALREPLTRRGARRHWMWVLVAGELERIVGAASLAERDPLRPDASPDGRIDFSILPVWSCRPAAVAPLLAAAVTHARSLGLSSVEAQAALDTPAAGWLLAEQFIPGRIQEIWRVPLDTNFARRHAAVERALARRPVVVRPISDNALPAVRALCSAHGLLPPSRVSLARDQHDGLDPRLSFVCGSPEAPAAVLLARLRGTQPYLEVLARAPGAPSHGPEIGALLHAFFSAALALGATETICVMASDRAPDTARLLARADAQRIERLTAFRRDLSPAPAAP